MLGLVHIVLKDLVLTKFGEDRWATIGKNLGLTDEGTILDANKQYDDSVTLSVLVATSKVLGVSVHDTLRAFGQHFVTYTSGPFLHLLKSMGDTLPEFCSNLNNLHRNLERKFLEAKFPVHCRCSCQDKNSFILSYSSQRGTWFSIIIEGMLIELGRSLYNQNVEFDLLAEPHAGFNTTWKVTCKALVAATAVTTPITPQVAGGFFAWHQRLAYFFTCSTPTVESTEMDAVMDVLATEDQRSTDVLIMDYQTFKFDRVIEERAVFDGKKRLRDLESRTSASKDPATILMRATPASSVAAAWDDVEKLRIASEFWGTNVGYECDYNKSMTSPCADRFVTHSWSQPNDWEQIMGHNCHYGALKAIELRTIAEDIGEELGCGWSDVTFWIDKSCIPQCHALTSVCLDMLEEFIQRCDGMVVLLSWHYFSRLWCVYEWAAFLVYHDPSHVRICADAFLRPATRDKYVEAIREFSVDKAHCHDEADRLRLKAKVKEYYISEQHFEDFARGTAIALMALHCARKASRCEHAYEEDYIPWIQLAAELGYEGLAKTLCAADPIAWRKGAVEEADRRRCVRRPSRIFARTVDEWFLTRVQPLLTQMKHKSVVSMVLNRMEHVKKSHSPKRLNFDI